MAIIGSVSATIVFPSGWSQNMTVTIEDNCCVEHAKNNAQSIIKSYVNDLVEEEKEFDPDFKVALAIHR